MRKTKKIISVLLGIIVVTFFGALYIRTNTSKNYPPNNFNEQTLPYSAKKEKISAAEDASTITAPPIHTEIKAHENIKKRQASTTHAVSTLKSASQVEARILTDGMINVENAKLMLLRSDDFKKNIEALRSHEIESTLATDITKLYRTSIQEKLSNLDEREIRLNGFSCGEILCFGSISSNADSTWNAWLDQLHDDQSTPAYTFAQYDEQMRDGSIEHRFIFSTDPESSRVRIPN